MASQVRSHHHQSSPRFSLDSGLNPLATSFRPVNPSQPDTGIPASDPVSEQMVMPPNLNRHHSAGLSMSQPFYASNMQVVQSETHAGINRDMQWASLVHVQSLALPEYQQHQTFFQPQPSFQQQQHPQLLALHQHQALLHAQQQHQRQVYYQNQANLLAMARTREGISPPMALSAANFSTPMDVQPRIDQIQSHYYRREPQSQPMEPYVPLQTRLNWSGSGSSESSISTPHSLPAELPLDILTHTLTEIQLPETHISTPTHCSPEVDKSDGEPLKRGSPKMPTIDEDIGKTLGLPQVRRGKQRDSAQHPKGKKTTNPSGSPRAPSSSLMDRGKSTLTPVTERSEMSTPNASTSSAPVPRHAKGPRRRARHSKGHAGAKGKPGGSKKA